VAIQKRANLLESLILLNTTLLLASQTSVHQNGGLIALEVSVGIFLVGVVTLFFRALRRRSELKNLPKLKPAVPSSNLGAILLVILIPISGAFAYNNIEVDSNSRSKADIAENTGSTTKSEREPQGVSVPRELGIDLGSGKPDSKPVRNWTESVITKLTSG